MKIAIVCDDLIQFGGAEKVILKFFEIYTDAILYTPVISNDWKKVLNEKKIKYKTSFLQKFPFAVKLNRIYSVFLLHIFAIESFNFDGFDMVISSSSRYAHFALTKPETIHICYMHSPGRMFWEYKDYFLKERISGLFLLSPFLSLIRQMDYAAAQRVDYFISNSLKTQRRINKYYHRDSDVIHPFVSLPTTVEDAKGTYFLIISRLISWKRIDIAIEACNKLKIPLKIIGAGPDYMRLRSLAGPTVELLGFVSDKEKAEIISKSIALIVTQSEDFGITPLEAMSYGKPVLAYNNGGAKETVLSGVTGDFFDEQTSDSLSELLATFNPVKYKFQDCVNRSKDFSEPVFVQNLLNFTNRIYLNNHKIL